MPTLSPSEFTPAHRGGDGPPLVLLHGFLDTWRTWELVIPALERHFEVLAPTLPGHAGGPVGPPTSTAAFLDLVERTLDGAGFDTAHIAGNSLGGYTALKLAARGRALSVVALAPAGGWAPGDTAGPALLDAQMNVYEQSKLVAPYADRIVSTAKGRRQATSRITVNYEHIPAELIAHQLLGVARCDGAQPLIEGILRDGWNVEVEQIDCPVRVVWGTEDVLLPWPSAAARYRDDWLPNADWVLLDDVGHCPQLDVPAATAELIRGFISP